METLKVFKAGMVATSILVSLSAVYDRNKVPNSRVAFPRPIQQLVRTDATKLPDGRPLSIQAKALLDAQLKEQLRRDAEASVEREKLIKEQKFVRTKEEAKFAAIVIGFILATGTIKWTLENLPRLWSKRKPAASA